MIKIGVIIMALVSFLNAGWFSSLFDSTPTSPYHVPIDLSKARSEAEMIVRLKSNKDYVFSLRFVRNELDADAKSNLYKFVGRIIYDVHTKVTTYSGVDIPVQLEIFKLNDDSTKVLVLDQGILTRGSVGNGSLDIDGKRVSFIQRYIHMMKFEKGKYLIRLKTIKDFPELKSNKVLFAIHGMRKV